MNRQPPREIARSLPERQRPTKPSKFRPPPRREFRDRQGAPSFHAGAPTIWHGHFEKRPSRAWKYRGRSYVNLDVLYDLFPPTGEEAGAPPRSCGRTVITVRSDDQRPGERRVALEGWCRRGWRGHRKVAHTLTRRLRLRFNSGLVTVEARILTSPRGEQSALARPPPPKRALRRFRDCFSSFASSVAGRVDPTGRTRQRGRNPLGEPVSRDTLRCCLRVAACERIAPPPG
jgi:hypothetical protein